MGKSIASKTLAIAKKKEAERLKSLKKSVLDEFQKYFDERAKSTDILEEDEEYLVKGKILYKFNFFEIERICKEAGFLLRKNEISNNVYWSIPKWVKGQKRTQAQLMLYRCNMGIKRNIKSKKEDAKKICKEALEKIKAGNFESEKQQTTEAYEIRVKVSYTDNNTFFLNEIIKFFEKKNFSRIYLDCICNTLILWLK